MPQRHTETRNMVFHKWPSVARSLIRQKKETMSRTIEAIIVHMAAPSNGVANQRNGTEKLEGEFTVKKGHYVWSEARFVRAMMPFHSNVRVGYDGKEVDGKNALDLMTLA